MSLSLLPQCKLFLRLCDLLNYVLYFSWRSKQVDQITVCLYPWKSDSRSLMIMNWWHWLQWKADVSPTVEWGWAHMDYESRSVGDFLSAEHNKENARRTLSRVRQLENHCNPAVNVWYSDKLSKSPFALEPVKRRRWTTESKAAWLWSQTSSMATEIDVGMRQSRMKKWEEGVIEEELEAVSLQVSPFLCLSECGEQNEKGSKVQRTGLLSREYQDL